MAHSVEVTQTVGDVVERVVGALRVGVAGDEVGVDAGDRGFSRARRERPPPPGQWFSRHYWQNARATAR